MIDLIKREREDKTICEKLEVFLPDEFAARGCSYHIQQAVEKQLKVILLANGIDYPRTHNIQELLDKITDSEIDIGDELANDIEVISDTLSAWEALSRYEAHSTFTERKYSRAKGIYNRLETIVQEYENEYTLAQNDDSIIDDYDEENEGITSP